MSRVQFTSLAAILAFFGFLGGLTASHLVPGSAQASNDQVITARAIQLIDKDGQVVGTLGDPDGKLPLIVLQDPRARGKIILGVSGDKTGVFITADQEHSALTANRLGIMDRSETRVMLGGGGEAGYGLSFFKDKKAIATLGATSGNGYGLLVADRTSGDMFKAGCSSDAAGVELQIRNGNGQVTWQAP